MRFKKIIYSGVCLCGHSYGNHHLGMIANPEAYKIMGPYLPQEGEYCGCNEYGGMDEEGEIHCCGYIDKDNPDPEILNRWRGTKR